MKKFCINITKISCVALIIFLVGCFYTLNGVIIRTNLRNIQKSYDTSDFKKGLFIETDILSSKVIVTIPTNQSGTITFYPFYVEEVRKKERTYIMSLNEWSDYYISLIVPYEYYNEIEEFINDRSSTYHITGKFERLKRALPYDVISKVTGVKGDSEINKIVSPKYAIRIVDFNEEKNILIKGICVMCTGVILFFSSIKKRIEK